MSLLLGIFIIVFVSFSGGIFAEEAKDSDLINRLLHEVENLKMQQIQMNEKHENEMEKLKLQNVKTNAKYEKLKTQQVKTDEKYEKLNQEFLDLREEQIKWATLRKEIKDINSQCKPLLEKFTFNKKNEGQLPFSKLGFNLNGKVDPTDSYKNDSDTDAAMKPRSADSYKKHVLRLQKRLNPPSSQISTQNGVAFYADLTHDVTTLGRLHPIVYDRVKTNIGGAYNKNDGIFTVPVSGIYVFSWYGMAITNTFEQLDIVVDGQLFARSYTSNANFESASKTVVIDLCKGSNVWVRTSPNDGQGKIYGANYNSFAGWLLYSRES